MTGTLAVLSHAHLSLAALSQHAQNHALLHAQHRAQHLARHLAATNKECLHLKIPRDLQM